MIQVCRECGEHNPPLKKTCQRCGAFLAGWTVNNVTGKFGYRNKDGTFATMQEMNENSGTRERVMDNLEGNIGAGKSTLGAMLEATGKFAFLPEPVSVWQQDFPENLLNLFYSDQKRWGFTFQLAAFATRAKTWDDILKVTDHSHVIMERSIFSDRNVFARNCHESGLMTDTEHAIYAKLWDWLNERWCVQPNLTIYLRTPAKICRERIMERDRVEEKDAIPLKYLEDLERLHDEWLLSTPGVVVIEGEGDLDLHDVLTRICGD